MFLILSGVPVILGVNLGPGFINQAREYNPAVYGPETMCSMVPDTESWPVNEFAKVFGRPVFHLVTDGDRILWCYPLRISPCGSTDAAARELNGQKLLKDTLKRVTLSVCHNCRAPWFGRTCDKEKAGLIHLEEFLRALKGINPELWTELSQVIEKGECLGTATPCENNEPLLS